MDGMKKKEGLIAPVSRDTYRRLHSRFDRKNLSSIFRSIFSSELKYHMLIEIFSFYVL
jgi:hypothetical protein